MFQLTNYKFYLNLTFCNGAYLSYKNCLSNFVHLKQTHIYTHPHTLLVKFKIIKRKKISFFYKVFCLFVCQTQPFDILQSLPIQKKDKQAMWTGKGHACHLDFQNILHLFRSKSLPFNLLQNIRNLNHSLTHFSNCRKINKPQLQKKRVLYTPKEFYIPPIQWLSCFLYLRKPLTTFC